MKMTCTRTGLLSWALGLVALGLNAPEAEAQLAANTYQFSAISGSYAEISGGTAITNITVDDGLSPVLPIGFTFNYCGTDYTQVKVCSNGWVTFNTTVTNSTWTNSLANIESNKPMLMPLFDDLAGWGAGAEPTYLTTGTAPNRIFTIQLKNWNWRMSSGSAPNLSIQVKLYESSNVIEYIYRQEAAPGDPTSYGATIGIGDNSSPVGYLVLNNASATPTASSTNLTLDITSRPASGQIYRFKPLPAIDMQADSVVVDTPFCSNSSQSIAARIANLGTATINSVDVYWSVDGVAQTPVTYSAAPISNIVSAPANTAMVVLGDVFFPDSNPRTIKVWTYTPNGMADEVPDNDTVTQQIVAGLQGVEVHITPSDTTICQGDNVVLDAGTFPNNPIYIWSSGNLDQTMTVGLAGQYSVKVQNNMGCFDRDTVTITVHPDPVVNSIAIVDNGDNTIVFNVVGAQHILNWEWDFGDGTAPVSGSGMPIPQQVHHFDNPGEYDVTLTLSNDCNEIVTTRLVKIDALTGIDNLSALQKELRVYPNPGKTSVTVSSYDGTLRITGVAVYNLMGQQVYKATVKGAEHKVDVSAMASGIYNVIIETDKGKVTKKLEVIK